MAKSCFAAETLSVFSLPRKPTNEFRLEVSLDSAHADWGRFKLLADGQALMTDGTAANNGPGILIGKTPITPKGAPIRIIEQTAGADWEYARLDLAAGYSGLVTRYQRHLLFVQPDLFVVYDDIEAKEPAAFALALNSCSSLEFDQGSRDFRFEDSKAGLVAHVLLPDRAVFQNWERLDATNAAASRVFRTASTNHLQEMRAIIAMRPHRVGQRKDTGFKLLQSNTAIGARIWRSGLPTLIAFRTVPDGEADLTGLKFNAPLAVDVFNPKPRSRSARTTATPP